jgi:hypothetical protein
MDSLAQRMASSAYCRNCSVSDILKSLLRWDALMIRLRAFAKPGPHRPAASVQNCSLG